MAHGSGQGIDRRSLLAPRQPVDPQSKGSVPTQTRRQFLWVVLVLYLLLACLWAVLIPPYETPDEIHHFAFVRFVAETGRLPVQKQESYPFIEPEIHQPPLYYVAAAGVHRLATALFVEASDLQIWQTRINPNFVWKSQGARQDDNFFLQPSRFGEGADGFPYDLIGIRLFSVFLGAITLVKILAASSAIWPRRPVMAVFATALVAFLPQFTFITASVNNDNMALAVGALCIWQIVRIGTRSQAPAPRDYLLLGLLLGLGVLAKLTLLSLGIAALLLPFLVESKDGPNPPVAWLLLGLGFLVVGGWWFGRNLLLYRDLLGSHWKVNPEAFAWDLDPKGLFSDYFHLNQFWKWTGESLVGKFGFAHIEMPHRLYQAYLALFLVALTGIPLYLRRFASSSQKRMLGLMAVIVLLSLMQLIYFNLAVSQPQGRYFFHALAAIAMLVVAGCWAWGRSLHVVAGRLWRQVRRQPSATNGSAGRAAWRVGLLYLSLFLLAGMNLYVLRQVVAVYGNAGL